ATDVTAATPQVVRGEAKRTRLFTLQADQLQQLRAARAGVVSTSGTAAGAMITGLKLAGKTGTAQTRDVSGKEVNDAWFVGYAPADNPSIVVAIMLENVTFHGSVSAGLASKIMGHYLHVQLSSQVQTEG